MCDLPPPTAAAPSDPAAAQASADPRHELGRLGERLAGEHLQRLGFHVLARNVRCGGGEIDLIACDGRALAFVEVKTRRRTGRERHLTASRTAAPLERLGPRQRARLRRAAAAWLRENPRGRPRTDTVRLDAIGVTVDGRGRLLRLDHVESAW